MSLDRYTEYMRIDALVPAIRNPKRHELDELRASVERFGFTAPPMIDERTGRLVAGHGRVQLLQIDQREGTDIPEGIHVDHDGMWLVPVTRGWASVDDAEAEAYLIADNRLGERAGWIEPQLVPALRDLSTSPLGLAGTGFTMPQLDRLKAIMDAEAATADEDEGRPPLVITVPTDPITKRGDVWQLGRHRIMCGDCRDGDEVRKLLAHDTIHLAVTSPPYADRRKYDESSGFQPIPPDRYVEWFAPVAENIAALLAEDGSWVVNIKPGADGLDTDLYVLDLVMAHVRQWGWHFASEFCWERNGVPKGPVQRLKNQFEPVYQFTRGRWKFRPKNVRHPSDNAIENVGPGGGNTSWQDQQGGGAFLKPSQTRRAKASGTFTRHQGAGGDDGGEIFATDRGDGLAYPGNRIPPMMSTHDATGHTAAFPVGLPEFFVRLMTDPGDVVFDPFVGSGSSILAAHNQDRTGVGMELSAAYVDVTCARFQAKTGIKPVKMGTRKAVDFSHVTRQK